MDLNSSVNTVDVIAIQRFFLGLSTGIANVGKYKFTPVNRSYLNLMSNQTAQNYDTLVFGDVASSFVERVGGPSATEAGDGTSADEVPATVATLSLPDVAVDQSMTSFTAAVRTSAIDAKNELIGFQGDFTFDERVVTFQSEPVQKAGITGGNWNVSGNVLPGAGPIRTLRISAYSNDFTPLSGIGNAVRTEDDQGEPGGSKHAIALGRTTGPLHLHRRRSQHAETWQRSAWQRHSIGEAQVKPAPPKPTPSFLSPLKRMVPPPPPHYETRTPHYTPPKG